MTQLAVDLFSGGARGWDIHDTELGLRTLGYENDDAAHSTALAAGFDSFQVDVREHEPPEWSGKAGLKAGPPCTPFTVAGAGKGRKLLADLQAAADQMSSTAYSLSCGAGTIPAWITNRDETAALVLEPLRWAMIAHARRQPFRWIVLEQAREVLPLWETVAERLADIGYRTWTGVLFAEQYGVPQTRRRAVLIASRDKQVHRPTPTHRKYPTEASSWDDGLQPWVTMADALPELHDNDTHLRSNYGTGGVAANRGMRALSQPAPTITSKFNRNKWVVAGEVVRPLSVPEATRLQTLPADHPWQGSKTEIQLQIGNAIPPLLARAILQQVI